MKSLFNDSLNNFFPGWSEDLEMSCSGDGFDYVFCDETFFCCGMWKALAQMSKESCGLSEMEW